ncbi:MAG: flagellin [Thermodesulfobacteriota bacterium]|nr:flagellin [Thermodesulfobacteriota bacterium]
MALYVNTNMMALNAARNLGGVYDALSKSTQRLSSGLRVNSAADDAAGLAVREQQRADIAVLNQGIRNASDAISMIQVAEGALQVVDEKLIRMKELAEQASTGTYTDAQRQIMHDEFDEMAKEITRISEATDFNGRQLLNGDLSSGLKIHFGTGNDSAQDYYYVSIGNMTAEALAVNAGNAEQAEVGSQASVSSQAAYTGVASSQSSLSSIASAATQGAVASAASMGTVGSVGGAASAGSIASRASVASQGSVGSVGGVSSQASVASSTFQTSVASQASIASQLSLGSRASHAAIGTVASVSSAASQASVASQAGVASQTSAASVASQASVVSRASVASEGSYGSVGSFGSVGSVDAATTRGSVGSRGAIASEAAYGGISSLASQGSIGSAASQAAVSTQGAVSSQASVSAYGVSLRTQHSAQEALAVVDTAIQSKDEQRASLGAKQNRLENTITNLTMQAENTQAAESRISDVDVAAEMTEFTKNNIMAQAATAMLAQANQLPQLAIQLIGG